MAVFRVNKLTTKGYTIVMNKMLQDKELSLEAKGLLGLILTLPDDWDYSINGLVSITNQKYNKVNKTIKELIDKGYIVRTKLNPNETTSGRFEYIYDIYEEKTTVKKQQVVKQPIVKQPIVFDTLNIINNKQNTNIQNNKINKKELENEFEQLWSIYPRKEGKKKSLDYYIKARQKGVTYDIVKQGIEKYVSYVKNERKDKKYILQGKTYFCNEGWNDEYDTNESYLKVIERECMEENGRKD